MVAEASLTPTADCGSTRPSRARPAVGRPHAAHRAREVGDAAVGRLEQDRPEGKRLERRPRCRPGDIAIRPVVIRPLSATCSLERHVGRARSARRRAARSRRRSPDAVGTETAWVWVPSSRCSALHIQSHGPPVARAPRVIALARAGAARTPPRPTRTVPVDPARDLVAGRKAPLIRARRRSPRSGRRRSRPALRPRCEAAPSDRRGARRALDAPPGIARAARRSGGSALIASRGHRLGLVVGRRQRRARIDQHDRRLGRGGRCRW